MHFPHMSDGIDGILIVLMELTKYSFHDHFTRR